MMKDIFRFLSNKMKMSFLEFFIFWSYSALFTQLCFATTNLKSFRISSKSEKLSFWFCWLQIDFPCFCFYEMSLIMVNFVCSTFLSSYAVVPIPLFSLSKYEWNDACFTTSYPKLLVFSLLLSFQFSHWEGIEPTNNQITFTLQWSLNIFNLCSRNYKLYRMNQKLISFYYICCIYLDLDISKLLCIKWEVARLILIK